MVHHSMPHGWHSVTGNDVMTSLNMIPEIPREGAILRNGAAFQALYERLDTEEEDAVELAAFSSRFGKAGR